MITFREVRPEELQSVLDLYRHLHDRDSALPTPEVLQNVWDEICLSPHIRCCGIFLQDKLVSCCIMTVIPNLTRSCRPYALIENVVTLSEQRNKGFGKQLLQYAIDFAWEKNCYKIMLMTGRLNEETFRFYESAGFDRHSKQAFVMRRG